MFSNGLVISVFFFAPALAIGISLTASAFALRHTNGQGAAIFTALVSAGLAWVLYFFYTMPNDADLGPGIIDLAFIMLFAFVAGPLFMIVGLVFLQLNASRTIKTLARFAIALLLLPLVHLGAQFIYSGQNARTSMRCEPLSMTA